MKIQIRQSRPVSVTASEPLYERVPTADADGKAYSDFMVLIPGIRDLSRDDFADRVASLQAVLAHYHQVVFADLNVRLNLLWVTLRPQHGLIPQIAAHLRERVPEARLVAHE